MKGENGEVYSSTILKLGGKKSFGHRWQWRTCTIMDDCKLAYTDPKTNEYRGFINLVKCKVKIIEEDDNMIEKLRKFKVPSQNFKDVKEFSRTSYFLVKPNNSCKTYYFAVEHSDRSQWIKFITYCVDGPKSLQQKISQSLELPTLLLHTDSPLTTPRVDFSSEVMLREIDYDLSDTLSGEYNSPPSSSQFSISFSDSCSSKFSSYFDSPRRMSSDEVGNKISHSGSMSSTSSTISYRSSSYGTSHTLSDSMIDSLQSNNTTITQNESSDLGKTESLSPRSCWRASKSCSQSNLQCLISPHRSKQSLDSNEAKIITESQMTEEQTSSPRTGVSYKSDEPFRVDLTLNEGGLITEG